MTDPHAQTTQPTSSPRTGRGRTLRRFGLSIGALLLASGLVILGSVAWELWGTGIATARAQHRLGQQFQADVSHAPAKPATTAPPTTSTPPASTAANANVVSTPAASPSSSAPIATDATPPVGTLVAHLVIPKIGVSNYVVEGVGSAQLAEGTGHYPGTAPIGGDGNVGIAGHRTTHEAPFYNLNELKPGDLIYLTNTAGQLFTYSVTTQFVVAPSDSAVLDPTPTPTLTLTTCNPRYSASQRLIVKAALVP